MLDGGKAAGEKALGEPEGHRHAEVATELREFLEHRDLIESIRAGTPLNDARRIAETSLTSILGREVAYTGKIIGWDELFNSDLDLTPPKLEFGPHEARPVRRPGKA